VRANLVKQPFEHIGVARHLSVFHKRNHKRNYLSRIFLRNGVYRVPIIGVFLVHSVDENHGGNFVRHAVVQCFFGAYRQRAPGTRDHQRAVGNRHGLHELAFKVEKSGNVYKIELDALEGCVCRCKTYGNLLSYFFGVEIHRGIAVVYSSLPVYCLCIKQYGFGQRSLSFTAVSQKSYVANVFC